MIGVSSGGTLRLVRVFQTPSLAQEEDQYIQRIRRVDVTNVESHFRVWEDAQTVFTNLVSSDNPNPEQAFSVKGLSIFWIRGASNMDIPTFWNAKINTSLEIRLDDSDPMPSGGGWSILDVNMMRNDMIPTLLNDSMHGDMEKYYNWFLGYSEYLQVINVIEAELIWGNDE